MGQYHTVYNLDKKEFFSLAGAKLWEKAYSPLHSMALNVLLCNSNGRGGGDLANPIHQDFKDKAKYSYWSNSGQGEVKVTKAEYEHVQAALDAVSGRWAGDRIVIQGDYAKKGDPAYQTEAKLKGYKSINSELFAAFEAVMQFQPEDKEFLESLGFEKKFRGGK